MDYKNLPKSLFVQQLRYQRIIGSSQTSSFTLFIPTQLRSRNFVARDAQHTFKDSSLAAPSSKFAPRTSLNFTLCATLLEHYPNIYIRHFFPIIMKYLAYFRPNEELSDLILRQNHIVLPGSGLHSTLCFFYMEPEEEKNLVTDLSQICFNPFEFETLAFDDFDRNSLVLKLSRSEELLQLHKGIVSVVKNYANAEFSAIAKQYFGDNYKPHLTISRSSSEFDRNSKELIGQKDRIARYTLAKKVDENWKEIGDFYSSR